MLFVSLATIFGTLFVLLATTVETLSVVLVTAVHAFVVWFDVQRLTYYVK